MSTYSAEQRRKYATVGKSGYPIGDANHARAALRFINKGGLSADEKQKVIAKARTMLASK